MCVFKSKEISGENHQNQPTNTSKLCGYCLQDNKNMATGIQLVSVVALERSDHTCFNPCDFPIFGHAH